VVLGGSWNRWRQVSCVYSSGNHYDHSKGIKLLHILTLLETNTVGIRVIILLLQVRLVIPVNI
jgi:hypothetical protein